MKGETPNKDERIRLREIYLENGLNSMSDAEVLELFLFYAVPAGRVNEAKRALLDYFENDIEKIFRADIDELTKVDGINSNAAAVIHLVNDVSNVVRKRENASVSRLDSCESAKAYVKNALDGLTYERLIAITLGEDNTILSCTAVADGTVNIASVELVKIVKCIIRDNARSIIIAHNHPDGDSTPSRADRRFTYYLQNTLADLNVELRDHLIVGRDGVYSMLNGEDSD